jgi:hypothetical protein
VFSDFGFDEGAQVVREPGVRALFVNASQPAVSGHIGGQDGCEASFYALGSQSDLPLKDRDYTTAPAQRLQRRWEMPLHAIAAAITPVDRLFA